MKIEEANKILEISLTRDIALDKEAVKKIKTAKKVFTNHYKCNPKAFIEDYFKILHGLTNEECDFVLNEAQDAVIEALRSSRRIAVPKARQLGITTLTNALALFHAVFTTNANVIVMAMKTDNAQDNLRSIKTMYKKMPEWVQKLVIVWDEKLGHLNNQSLWLSLIHI